LGSGQSLFANVQQQATVTARVGILLCTITNLERDMHVVHICMLFDYILLPPLRLQYGYDMYAALHCCSLAICGPALLVARSKPCGTIGFLTLTKVLACHDRLPRCWRNN
jgi:hypothetical protein